MYLIVYLMYMKRGCSALPSVSRCFRSVLTQRQTSAILFAAAEAEELLKIHGRNELAEKKTPKWLIYLKLVSHLLLEHEVCINRQGNSLLSTPGGDCLVCAILNDDQDFISFLRLSATLCHHFPQV